MDQRLSLVTLAVDDLDRSVDFYRHLGWSVGFQNASVAFFQLNGIVLSLYSRKEFASDLGVDERSLGPGGAVLAYNVREEQEVEAVLAEAERAGGKILVPAKKAEWGGTSGYFADPAGHRWEVAYNPAWPIAPDGGLTLTV